MLEEKPEKCHKECQRRCQTIPCRKKKYIYICHLYHSGCYARNYVRRTCRGGDHQKSIIHHPLVMDVSSTPCAITDLPIMILYHPIIHVYIYIYIERERAISTLISTTQYRPNKSPHIFISSQVPPSQIVFPMFDPRIDPHV